MCRIARNSHSRSALVLNHACTKTNTIKCYQDVLISYLAVCSFGFHDAWQSALAGLPACLSLKGGAAAAEGARQAHSLHPGSFICVRWGGCRAKRASFTGVYKGAICSKL